MTNQMNEYVSLIIVDGYVKLSRVEGPILALVPEREQGGEDCYVRGLR